MILRAGEWSGSPAQERKPGRKESRDREHGGRFPSKQIMKGTCLYLSTHLVSKTLRRMNLFLRPYRIRSKTLGSPRTNNFAYFGTSSTTALQPAGLRRWLPASTG